MKNTSIDYGICNSQISMNYAAIMHRPKIAQDLKTMEVYFLFMVRFQCKPVGSPVPSLLYSRTQADGASITWASTSCSGGRKSM